MDWAADFFDLNPDSRPVVSASTFLKRDSHADAPTIDHRDSREAQNHLSAGHRKRPGEGH